VKTRLSESKAEAKNRPITGLDSSWGPSLEGPEKFSHPESRSKISNFMITELFYLHTLNMNRGFLHTRGFRLKMALQARKVSGAFEKRAPGPCEKDIFS